MSEASGWQEAVEYHEQTKHHFHRSARSLGYLDWKNQPDPFRRFAGAPTVPLLLAASDPDVSCDALFAGESCQPRAADLAGISLFFELSLAVSAWKEFRGSRWALRVNPSSGNLHPTEGYLLIGPTGGLCDVPALFHYAANDHLLERRATFASDAWEAFTHGLPAGVFFLGLTSVHWREAWKYGERAYRYCQHDAGHAIAAAAISAGVQGWPTFPLTQLGDDDLDTILGLDRREYFEGAEHEHPDCLMLVAPKAIDASCTPQSWRPRVEELAKTAEWHGRANRLSAEHVDWEIIETTAAACRKLSGPMPGDGCSTGAAMSDGPGGTGGGADGSLAHGVFCEPMLPAAPRGSAAQIIRQRRSALDFDSKTAISADALYLMLDRTLPRFDLAPWRALGPPVCIHLGLFVHRVTHVVPGLYCLVRDSREKKHLAAAMHTSFEWATPRGAPAHLPLYRLAEGDARRAAAQVSCGQEIAGDSAFTVGMLAKFEEPLHQHGGWFYRRLHWEAGVIGQILYLEAEAAGIRGTGIGCFFDDPAHEVFGLKGREYQTLYHFTVGRQVEDLRLMSYPAYGAEVHARR